MDFWIQIIVTIVGSVLASSGLWTYVSKKAEKKDAKTELLRGIAHDRIVFLGMSYINRGYITQSEYDDLRTYLYEPYVRAGGNGTAERVMREVENLPITKNGSDAIMADLNQR